MKILRTLFLVFLTLILISCEKTDNAVSTSDLNESLNSNTSNQDLVNLTDSFVITKSIDGSIGGSIVLDTFFVDETGKTVELSINLTFDPNSFSGTKEISIIPNPTLGSVQFSPAMSFSTPAKLTLRYTGIDLTSLGFDSNSTVDFVYISDSGLLEYLLKDEVKIKFDRLELYTKNAKLFHFSRYAFVR